MEADRGMALLYGTELFIYRSVSHLLVLWETAKTQQRKESQMQNEELSEIHV